MRSASARKRSSSAAVAASPRRRAWSRRHRSRSASRASACRRRWNCAARPRSGGRPAAGGPLRGRIGRAAPDRRTRRTRIPRRSWSSSPPSAPRPPAARQGRRSPRPPAGRTPPCAARAPSIRPTRSCSAWRAFQKGAYFGFLGRGPSWDPSPPARRRPAPYPPAARAPGRSPWADFGQPGPRQSEEEQNGGEIELSHTACSCGIGAEMAQDPGSLTIIRTGKL